MNIKVARTMLILCCIYMVGFYVLKFIFPEKLLLVVTDPNIISAGNYVDSQRWLLIAIQLMSTFVTYYLFVSASKGSFKIDLKELLYLLGAIAIDYLVVEFKPELMAHTSTSLMFLLALLCKGKLLYATVAFVIHGYLQQFLFSISGFETIIPYLNTVSAMVLTLECYVWLVILALISYLMERKNGSLVSTISK